MESDRQVARPALPVGWSWVRLLAHMFTIAITHYPGGRILTIAKHFLTWMKSSLPVKGIWPNQAIHIAQIKPADLFAFIP
jgi:hypothetical protein